MTTYFRRPELPDLRPPGPFKILGIDSDLIDPRVGRRAERYPVPVRMLRSLGEFEVAALEEAEPFDYMLDDNNVIWIGNSSLEAMADGGARKVTEALHRAVEAGRVAWREANQEQERLKEQASWIDFSTPADG
jgi:hypothetical protein